MQAVRTILILAVLALAICAAWLVYLIPWLCLFAGIALLIANAKQGWVSFSTHGTARWADEADLQRAGMLDADSGLILGNVTPTPPSAFRAIRLLFDRRVKAAIACEQFVMSLRLFAKRKPREVPVRLPNAVHTAVFAPTGVGKGVSMILPFLKASTDSAVVLDFKGENAKLTAEERRKLGHKVVLLDPFRAVTETPDSFNPLDMIDPASPHALDDCRDLANALVIATGKENDPHWVESAKAFIAAIIAVVVYYGDKEDRSLQTVKDQLSDPQKIKDAISLMCRSDAWGGLLARMGNSLTNYKEKELGSVMTNTLRFLSFLDTPAVVESTKASSFDPAELHKGKMTVYLIISPEKMRAQSPLLRMWIGSMLRACVRGGLQEKNKTHFVLDEASSLGWMETLDDAIDKYRGYGVRLQFFYQSTGQLKNCFPADQGQTLLSNTTQVFFGVNDQQTADYVSARLGEQTIVVDSGGTNDGSSKSYQTGSSSSSHSRGRSSNWGLAGRKLLQPEEVMALDARIALTFTPGIPPLATRLIRWYEEEEKKPSRLRHLLRNLEITTAAVCLLALSLGLVWAMARVTSNPQGAPHGAVHQQGYRR